MTHVSPAKAPRRSLRRGLNRKGAIGVGFAVAATAVLGMGALATEGGLWYMSRRNAQSAADAGAIAGAIVIGYRGNDAAGRTAGEAAALNLAARNSFANGVDGATVTATAAGTRITVRISKTQFMGLARLISDTPPTATAVAAAEIIDTGDACILSLRGRVTITGSNITSASDCLIASNALGTRSVEFGGNAVVNAYSVRSTGDCYGCDSTNVTLEAPPLTNATVPMEDPYRDLKDPTLIPTIPNWNGNNLPSQCQRLTNYSTDIRDARGRKIGTAFTPTSWNEAVGGAIAICEDIPLNPGDTLNLSPGTYLFWNANLDVTGGTVNCTGCTFVFSGPQTGTGSNGIGTMRVSADSTVNLTAPKGTPWIDVRFRGIAIYRDYRANAQNEKNNPNNASRTNTVKIVGGANVNIAGAIYAPSSQVEYEGNSSFSGATGAPQNCVSIVASTVQIGGNTDLDISACDTFGTVVPRDRVVRLVW